MIEINLSELLLLLDNNSIKSYQEFIKFIYDFNERQLLIEGIKIVFSDKRIDIFFDKDQKCCFLRMIKNDFYIELGDYQENKYKTKNIPELLNSGSKTIYFISALAYVLKIKDLYCIDYAVVPYSDIELSIIKCILGKNTFYENFGYVPLDIIQYRDIKQMIINYSIENPTIYHESYNFLKKKKKEFIYDIDEQLNTIIKKYNKIIFIKNINKNDLLYWQLEEKRI